MKFMSFCLSLLMVLGIGQVAFAQEYGLGDLPLDPETYNRYLKIYPDQLKEGLPSSYNAKTAGIVTSAKDQGSCGSCWAFASAGAMESHILKGGGPTYDLSEQQQVSCNLAQYGCCGGSMEALQYWQSTGPILESCGPYGEASTSCPPTHRTVACSSMSGCSQINYRITNWHTVNTTTDDFKTSLYNYGPSYWRFQVYSDFNNFWNTASPRSIYRNISGTTNLGGHAVLLIGWDDTKGAFLCKNSWGATGGPQGDGTFWIAYTGHYNNLGFKMANFELAGGSYAYCFKLGSWCNQIYLNVSGDRILGYNDSCGDEPTPIVGLFKTRWGFYIDFAETSSIAGMAAFLTPSAQMMYVRFNKNGTVSDYGPLTFGPCTTAPEGLSAAEPETAAGDVLPDRGILCLKTDLFCDQLYVLNDYIGSHGILFGTDDNCGDTEYTVAGYVLDNDFLIYGDFPENTVGWGYAMFGTVSGMGGSVNYLNLFGTAASLSYYDNFSFVPCTSVPDGMPPVALGPLVE
jgi:hypothetical protein